LLNNTKIRQVYYCGGPYICHTKAMTTLVEYGTGCLFYFTSPQPIRPKEASDSDFTIEDVMLWPDMRFSLRSKCERCSAGYLHNSLAYGSRSSHSCSTRQSLHIEDRMLPARNSFKPTSSTMTCPASPPLLFYFASTH